MKTTSNLQVVTLAHLSRSPDERKTLYEVMTEVNQLFALIDTPYSPGTFYPAMKSLNRAKLISINQSGCLIEQLGLTHLEAILLNYPLPVSLTGVLYRLMAANISADADLKSKASKRIDIELIKFDQIGSVGDIESGHHKKAPNIIRQHIANCLRRILIDLGDGE